MKANQAFRRSDDAVSPVIAVILMVAITVVLAATVYVWVSGFGSPGGTASKVISLSSNGPLSSNLKSYTIASATSGMRYGDFYASLNGARADLTGNGCSASPTVGTLYMGCSANAAATNATIVGAGDSIKFFANSGDTLRLVDAHANSVMLTVTIG